MKVDSTDTMTSWPSWRDDKANPSENGPGIAERERGIRRLPSTALLNQTRRICFLIVVLISVLPCRTAIAQTSSSREMTPTVTIDTYIASGRPDTAFDTEPRMWTGQNLDPGYGDEYLLMQFDAGRDQLAGAKITDATLTLNLENATRNDRPLALIAEIMLQPLPESPTWNNSSSPPKGQRQSPSVMVTSEVEEGIFVQFDVQDLVEEWLQFTNPSSPLTFFIGPENMPTSERERAFASTECGSTACSPSLSISYIPLGVPEIYVSNNPTGAVQPGDLITYTVQIIAQTSDSLEEIRVEGPVPDNTTFESATDDGVLIQNNKVLWEWDTLLSGESREIRYVVRRNAETTPPSQGDLVISKAGPLTLEPTNEITYTLTISNQSTTSEPISLTDFIIIDVIDDNADYIRSSNNGFEVEGSGGKIQWNLDDTVVLAAGESISVTLTVTATQTISNHLYDVTAVNPATSRSISATGRTTIVTYIGETPPIERIEHQGMTMWWKYRRIEQPPVRSNWLWNPAEKVFVPMIRQAE